MKDDLVALLDVRHGVADGVDPAGILVADGVGELDVGLLRPLSLEDVDVRLPSSAYGLPGAQRY